MARGSVSARRKLWEELHARYRLDSAAPLFAAFWQEWRCSKTEPERSLTAYILFALNDRLVTDLGTEWLFPMLRRAPADLRVGDVLAYLGRARQHPEVGKWSEETTVAVAQKYCASIRDFGLANGIVRKLTVRPRVVWFSCPPSRARAAASRDSALRTGPGADLPIARCGNDRGH